MHCFPFSLVQNGYHLIDPANKHPAWNICRLEKGTKHPNDKTYEGLLREVKILSSSPSYQTKSHLFGTLQRYVRLGLSRY